MPVPRRTPSDVRVGRTLNVGSTVRERSTGARWLVTQMWRPDCRCALALSGRHEPPVVRSPTFATIRADYELVA